MRKTLLLISALALAIAPLTAANAATHYKLTIGVGPQDIDVSRSHESSQVTIHGTLSGGPVKGKTVKIYRVNMSGPDQTKVHVHNLTLGSSGKYSTTDHPPLGGHYIYSAEKATSAGPVIATHHLDAYQFDFASVFYNGPQIGVTQNPTYVSGTHTKKESEPGYPSGFSNAFAIDGGTGNTLTFASSGNRCKGVTYHIALSDQQSADIGTTQFRYDVMKGDVSLYHHMMKKGDPAEGPSSAERKSFGTTPGDGPFQIKVEEGAERFLVGLPKIACTYPDPTNIN